MSSATIECPKCRTQNPVDTDSCIRCSTPIPSSGQATGPEASGDETMVGKVDDGDATVITGPGDQDGGETVVTGGSSGASTSGPSSLPPSAATGTLMVGSTLGGRYKIEGHLGSGGMGAVYKAHDIELDRMLALKVIRPHMAEDAEMLARFKQEIILSREITHRNVVRIYDLGQADGIQFISMEYIEGRELFDLMEERGALPPDEACEIVEQVCLALDAAHQQGVIHRDLKPQNIMMASDGRVVVMDFGIARSLELSNMTATGSLLGTPDYMSPEQVKGEKVDSRSDLFALGIIFYQMLTGQLPYDAETPRASMFMRTQERAKTIRDVNAELPPALNNLVSRCLETQAHKRIQSAREILQELAAFRGGTSQLTMSGTVRMLQPTTTKARKRLKVALMGAGALVVIAALVMGVNYLRSTAPSSTLQEAEVQPVVPPEDVVSLAILPFRNTSEDAELNWLGTGLAEMLRTDVGQTASLRTVSSDRLYQVLRDLRVSGDDPLIETTLHRVAEFANATTLVYGSYLKFGEQIQINATVRGFDPPQMIELNAEAANEQQLLRAVQELAQKIRENMALSTDAVKELEEQAFIPSASSVVALRHYNEGLEFLRQGNNLEAVTAFETAVQKDPDFALAYSKLSQAYFQLGRGPKAEEFSSQAVDRSEGLPSQERFLILAQSARVKNDLEQGVDAFKNLLRFRPSDPELHYELGALYEAGGALAEAQVEIAAALETDPKNVSAQLAMGRILIKSGKPQDALAPLNQSLSLAIEVDNKEARANSLQALGIAYRYLGRDDDALDHYEQSRDIKKEIGDQRGTASSLSEIASIHLTRGEFDEAAQNYEQAIEIARQIGDDYGLGRDLMNLGDVAKNKRDFDKALELTREALRIQMDIEDDWNQVVSLNNIGGIYGIKGEYSEALVYYQRAHEIYERIGAPGDIALSLYNLAEAYSLLGSFNKAEDHYLRALQLAREATDELKVAVISYSLAKVYNYQGRYGGAIASTEEALQIFRRIDEAGFYYVDALIVHGNALSKAGRFDDAGQALDESVRLARELGDPSLIAHGLVTQGDRLLSIGESSAAVKRYDEALQSAKAAGDPFLTPLVNTHVAQGQLRSGRAREAISLLEQTSQDASARGVKYVLARCALLLGSAHLSTGKNPELAERELRKALRESEALDSKSLLVQTHFLLSQAHQAMAQTDDAARQLEKSSKYIDEMRVEIGDDKFLARSDFKPIAEAVKSIAPPE